MSTVVRTLIGGAAGAGIGYLMYRAVGCRTGACPFYGNPWIAMSIWGLMGALIASGR